MKIAEKNVKIHNITKQNN